MQKKEEVAEVQENGRLRRRAKKEINYAAMGDESLTASSRSMSRTAPEDVDEELDQWIRLSDDFEAKSSHVK